MKSLLFRTFSIFIFIALAATSLLLQDTAISKNFSWVIMSANIIPLLALFFALYGITSKVGLSGFITLIITFILFRINDNKIENLQEPLIFSDFYLLPQMVTGWDLIKLYVADWKLILLSIFFISCIYFLSRLEKRTFSLKHGFFISSFGIFILIFIVNGKNYPATLYGEKNQGSTPWIFSSLAEKQGLIASLISGARVTSFVKPNFDADLIEEFINEKNVTDKSIIDNPDRPDIVLWLSESFFEPGILNEVDTCKTWPLMCKLQQKGLSGKMSVSTFGGNTTRTEFEVLTGVPFNALKGHDYPYISVVNSKTNSIAWQLQKKGYETIAIHPHDRTFWQRHKAMPLLGFQEFYGEESFEGAKRSGYYIADRYLNKRIQKHLKKNDTPKFILAISMENHGPWGTGTRENIDKNRLLSIPVPQKLDGDAALAWREYIYHGENSLNQLASLVNFIETRKRPTLVIFFGDHLPGLHKTFKILNFKNSNPGPTQKTPFMAFANYPLQENDWMPENAYELGVWTLNLAGQLSESNYRELDIALRHARNNETPDDTTIAVLKAMQARQLH